MMPKWLNTQDSLPSWWISAEHAGFSTKLVDIGYENIKITTPVDLILAEAILANRGKEKNND